MTPLSQDHDDGIVRFIRAIHRNGLRNATHWREGGFPGLSQSAIAAQIQLSRPTVSGFVQRAEGILANSGSGVLLDPEKNGVAIGIDFGEGHHRVALADVHGQLFEPVDGSRYETRSPAGKAYLSLEWAIETTEQLLNEASVAAENVCAVGVSLPGPVDMRSRRLRTSPPGMDRSWEVVDLETELASKLPFPPPAIESDCNASALAEHLWGATRDSTDALYVKISHRCACSLLINHRIYRGADGLAGRLGKTRVAHGNIETWEPVEDVFSLRALSKPPWDGLTVEQLVELANTDDDLNATLRRGARALGVALAPIIDAFNPESVVIGGSLGVASLTWVGSDLIDGIAALGDSPARAAISGRIRAGFYLGGSAVRGAIASALLEDAPYRIASSL